MTSSAGRSADGLAPHASDRLRTRPRHPASHLPTSASTAADRLRTSVADGLSASRAIPICALASGLVLAVGAAAIATSRRFDGLYGQDAYAYFDYATTSVRHSLLSAAPLESFFWPPGYPLLVATTALAIGPVPLAGQLVSLLMGALVPALTVLLAHELWPDEPALPKILAGAFVALCGQLWQSSVVVMADTTGLALATFSAVALVRYARGRHVAWLLAASAAIAWATLARWIYGLVAIPFTIYALSALLDGRRRPKERVAHAVAATAVAVLILGPFVAEPLVGLLRDPAQPAAFAGNFQVYSWSPLNALRHDFYTADGHLAYAQPNGLYYLLAPANLAYFGPLLAVWVLPGLWAARRWQKREVVLIVGWAAVVLAFHAGAPWQNFRFALAYLPPLAIVAATGLVFAWRRLQWPLRLLVPACASVGLLVSAGASVRLVERFIDTKDQELALVRWVQGETPAGTELLTFGPTLAFRHYSALPTLDLFDVSPTDIHAMLSDPAPHYVLVDTVSLESQWLDQAPSTNFELLRNEAAITEVGSAEGYTLYRVGAAPR